MENSPSPGLQFLPDRQGLFLMGVWICRCSTTCWNSHSRPGTWVRLTGRALIELAGRLTNAGPLERELQLEGAQHDARLVEELVAGRVGEARDPIEEPVPGDRLLET